jgi:hypothetical protein
LVLKLETYDQPNLDPEHRPAGCGEATTHRDPNERQKQNIEEPKWVMADNS